MIVGFYVCDAMAMYMKARMQLSDHYIVSAKLLKKGFFLGGGGSAV